MQYPQLNLDAVGIGAVVVDQLALVDRYPAADEKMAARHMLMQPGGPVPTALATLARLGRRTAFIGKTGTDFFGDWLAAELARRGVDVSPMLRDPRGRTGHALILSETAGGRRAVVHGEDGLAPFAGDELAPDRLPAARLVHMVHDDRRHLLLPVCIIAAYKLFL